MITVSLQDVSFKSTIGDDIIVTKIIHGVLSTKFKDSGEFIEFAACDNGWWWAGYSDYYVKINDDDILGCKGMTIPQNAILY